MISPTQRTLLALRKRGCLAAVVEKFNAHVTRPDGGKGIRQDLFGFIDVIAVEPDQSGVLAVQCARTDDAATRIAKIHSAKVWPKAERWLTAGNRISVMTWAVRVHPDKRRRWTLKVEPVRLEEETDAKAL